MSFDLCHTPMRYGVCRLPKYHPGKHARLAPVVLSLKEITRADGDLTTFVRPNREKGGWNVAVVRVSTRLPIFRIRHVKTKDQIQKEIQSDLRMIDKCGGDSKMADRSRHRA